MVAVVGVNWERWEIKYRPFVGFGLEKKAFWVV